jgi:hypothetical protein
MYMRAEACSAANRRLPATWSGQGLRVAKKPMQHPNNAEARKANGSRSQSVAVASFAP